MGGTGPSRPEPMNTPTPWWKGARGEWYVVAQGALLGLLAVGPRSTGALPAWPAGLVGPATWAGRALLVLGAVLALAAVLRLGRNLTPLPHPKDDGVLVDSGPYAWVRHPIYSGLILGGFGWALLQQGWLTLLWAVLLLVFFDIKSRREERWLLARFPAYADYRRRVRKLLPFIY